MKKTKSGELEFANFETKEDLEYFQKTINLTLFKVNGELICADFNAKRAVKFDKEKNEWVSANIDLIPENPDVLSESEERQIYEENPPFDVLEKLRKNAAHERIEFWNELRKTTRRKVVGWIYPNENLKVVKCDNDMFAALLNDIVEHGYYFAGDAIDLLPVFEDRTAVDFSSRGWGGVMAISQGDGDEMAYSYYAWQSLFDLTKVKFVYPKAGFYNKK